jgi:hypothetical protein
MPFFVLLVLSLALVAAVFTLGREIRLRRALEKLLHTLLARWRSHAAQSTDSDDPNPASRNDRL